MQLTHILTPDEVQALVTGYAENRAALANFAKKQASAELYPPGAALMNALVDTFYVQGSPPVAPPTILSGKDRERSIISILASHSASLPLAIHFYWGLGEGLTVAELAEHLVLVGGYAGMDCYTGGMGTLRTTLTALKGLFQDGIHPVDPITALGAIQSAFSLPKPNPS
ncbi:MAG: hypothetical protein ACJ8AT_20150 [Hyalangium sp.]|uniref:hypothetical protein n=1 Tax=Hyalangium sp. TaxID=2028555 RepID=UPI003899BAA1